MSYQVLARKWRPKSFASLVGQDHVVRALTHALEQNRLHHAYLFTGTRGVGKTTIARIMAKALNCERGVSATPCGVCSACTEIDGGRYIDYIELDAASNRGVDDMTQLLERAVYAPTQGQYKVYVIDEVHQLTGHAFNAMLKTLEEPPDHVKFILATTDPQKIPVTVLSRCLQFNLKQMSPTAIVDHLSKVLEAEGISFELPALRHLAKGAAGSMRDALSLLDQAIAHGGGAVTDEAVRAMLGTVGDEHLFAILDALVAADVQSMLSVAGLMDARSLSFDGGLQELATLFHRIALAQFAPDALLDPAERTRLSAYAQLFDAEYLQLGYQIAIHGRDELSLAPDEYSGFMMTLLR
ncbi:MAG: DNA polymerase III subunit gamma/tau, partial [Rhodocyclaceae bacterium]|nr:DNA polymerase III subunit gamma/tau [Rhodocyclaceae bacterium]